MSLTDLLPVFRSLCTTETGPFYLLDFIGIKQAVARLRLAWEKHFPHVILAYSFKTNALHAVTQFLRVQGLGAEVVSGAELQWAYEDGFATENIWFDGPLKTPEELHAAIKMGVHLQTDSLGELQETVAIAQHLNKPLQISARLSTRYRKQNLSRFGYTPEEFAMAQGWLRDRGLDFQGLHLHVGSNVLDPCAWTRALEENLPILQMVWPQLEWFDLGGGFPARNACVDGDVHDWAEFAQTIAIFLCQAKLSLAGKTLVLEPGRCLVEDHGYLLTQIRVQKVRPERNILVTDGGLNLVRSLGSWYHPIKFLREQETGQPTMCYEVFGSNCFESDCLHKSLLGPTNIGPGDWIVIGSAGGYDLPSANVWTRPSPAILGRFPMNEIRLLRRAQHIEEMRSQQKELKSD